MLNFHHGGKDPPLSMHLLGAPQLAAGTICLGSAWWSRGSRSRQRLAWKAVLWKTVNAQTQTPRQRGERSTSWDFKSFRGKNIWRSWKRSRGPGEDGSTGTRATGFAIVLKHRWVKIANIFRLLINRTWWGQTELEQFRYLVIANLFCKPHIVLIMVDSSWVYIYIYDCTYECAYCICGYGPCMSYIYTYIYATVYTLKEATFICLL